MTLKEENLAKLDNKELFTPNWNGYDSLPCTKEYIEYVKTIIHTIKDEYQPELMLIGEDNFILEWGSLHSPFYLEWTILPNNKYKIYISAYFDDIQMRKHDSFTQIILLKAINDVLAVSLNHPGWFEYYEKYLKGDKK